MHRNNAGFRKDFSELVGAARAFETHGQAAEFFGELLTPAEIADFALRWRLLKLLDSGVPQRKIAAELGISLCKITRGSRVLKKEGSRVKKALRGLK